MVFLLYRPRNCEGSSLAQKLIWISRNLCCVLSWLIMTWSLNSCRLRNKLWMTNINTAVLGGWGCPCGTCRHLTWSTGRQIINRKDYKVTAIKLNLRWNICGSCDHYLRAFPYSYKTLRGWLFTRGIGWMADWQEKEWTNCTIIIAVRLLPIKLCC